jgi:hypothetical protein
VRWVDFAVLLTAGAAAQLFAAHTPTNQVFHTGIAFTVAAALTLPFRLRQLSLNLRPDRGGRLFGHQLPGQSHARRDLFVLIPTSAALLKVAADAALLIGREFVEAVGGELFVNVIAEHYSHY